MGKLNQRKLHRKNSLNHKKNELESNLLSMGYNPKNMSLMRQRKLLNKAMKELSAKQNQSTTQPQPEQPTIDPLAFMKENDLFKDKQDEQIKSFQQPKHKKRAKMQIEDDCFDLEFGDVIRPNYQKEIDEEMYIRTGKSNKKISDRKLLRALKKREKALKKPKYANKKVLVDDLLANNAMKKMRGEKVTTDFKIMKQKMKAKHKRKVKSQRLWKEKLRKKQYRFNKFHDRRDANIAQYRQKKSDKRVGGHISTEQAIAEANDM